MNQSRRKRDPAKALSTWSIKMVRTYLGDEMANSNEHKQQLHQQAMAFYNVWRADRRRRLAEYDERVDAYHRALDVATAERDARDRAEYAAYLATRSHAAE